MIMVMTVMIIKKHNLQGPWKTKFFRKKDCMATQKSLFDSSEI